MNSERIERKNRWGVKFLVLLFLVVTIVPKITLIGISGSHAGIRVDDFFVLAYVLMFLYGILRSGLSKYERFYPLLKIFLLLVTSFTVSNILGAMADNISFGLAMLYTARAVEYFVLVFAGCDLIRLSGDKRIIIKLVKLTIIFHGIYMLLEATNILPDIGFLINRAANNRIYTTFSGPYEFAGYLSICLPILLVEILERKTYRDIVYVLIIVIGIILSESRIALVAVILVSLFLIFRYITRNRERNKGKKTVGLINYRLLIPVLLVAVLGVFLAPRFFDRFLLVDANEYINATQFAWEDADFELYKENDRLIPYSRAMIATQDQSFGFRISKWTILLKGMLETSPLFGLGMSVSGEAMDGSIMKLLCETGIIGLILWMILMFFVYKIMPKKWGIRATVAAIILTLFVNAAFIDIFDASKVMMTFWLVMGYFAYKEGEIAQKKTKVVHVLDGMAHGGVENVLYNYYSAMQNDNNYELVIVSHAEVANDERRRFEGLGFRVYEVTPKRRSLLRNARDLSSIVRKERPDIIHVHMGASSFLALFVGAICGVNVRVCHVHVTVLNYSLRERIEKMLSNIFCTDRMACSKMAAKCLFGRKKVVILKNVFDIQKFQYSKLKRGSIREGLKVSSEEILLGNIGRMTDQKNQIRLIEILSKMDKKFKLMLIGDGELREKLEKTASDFLMRDRIIFIGAVTDVANYYSAMDVFVSTASLREGFGMVLLEAQANGLPSVVSDAFSEEVTRIPELVDTLRLEDADGKWVNNIERSAKKRLKRSSFDKRLAQYDAQNNAHMLNDYYMRALEGVV